MKYADLFPPIDHFPQIDHTRQPDEHLVEVHEDGVVAVDEWTFHDMVVAANNTLRLEELDDVQAQVLEEDKPMTAEQVILRVFGRDSAGEPMMTEEHRHHLEYLYNRLMADAGELDGFLHEVAEYTC